jgi:hypothetical protein
MKLRKFTVGIVALLALSFIVVWLLRKPKPSAIKEIAPTRAESPKVAQSEKAPPGNSLPPMNPQRVVNPPSRGATEAEKWAWWNEMSAKDRLFDYKMPISFFGRVEDDHGQPVPGATVKFSWVNLSPEGTSQRNTTTDGAGFFSLTGAVGKALTVQLQKEGYRTYVTKNRFSFEYAMFADESYHEPDPRKPVVFVLRKNHDAEPLIVQKNQEAELAPGQSKSFSIGSAGAVVVVERLPNTIEGPRGWTARVSVPSGGLMFAMDEFPFEAPEGGYMPSIELSNKIPKSPVWSDDNGAAFFVKTSQGYGRITVRNTPGMAWVYVSSYFNPKPGSRNLEFDPAKLAPAPTTKP